MSDDATPEGKPRTKQTENPLAVQGSLDLTAREAKIVSLGADIRAEPPRRAEYLHTVLCQVGMPRKKIDGLSFERKSGKASLLITAGQMNNGDEWVQQCVPYGSRPRLALVHICSEATRLKSPLIPIGRSIRDFMVRLNIHPNGQNFARFRQQMNALSACQMQLAYGRRNMTAKPIDMYDAWLGNQEPREESVIRLSPRFYEELQDSAVPLDPRAIEALQNSSLALDLYTWLAHRLWRVRDPNGDEVFWSNLREQFGQEYVGANADKDFKRSFLTALQLVRAVYPTARVERTDMAFRLLPSPAPIPREKVVVDFGKAPDPAR